jgi:outer membrane protein
MKRFTLPLLLALTALSMNAQAELKAAYINSTRILQEAPQAKAATEALKKEFAQREQALRKLKAEIDKMTADLKKDGAIMSAEQRSKKEAEILEKRRKFQFDAQSLKEDVNLRRRQEVQKLRNSISAVIQNFARKKGYDFIFTDGVAFASDKVNVTEAILKELKKK